MRNETVRIGRRTVGLGYPPYVIAEIGVNHNGSVETAHRLIDAAADTGADAVKFQTFRPELVAHDQASTVDYQRRAGFDDGQRDMLDRLALPETAWATLSQHADERGLAFTSTAFDLPSLDLVCALDPPFLKIPSGEFTSLPFVKEVASRGKPVIASTGMCTMDEITTTCDVLAASGTPFVLLHCVSAYPAPIEEANLLAIGEMRRVTGALVGWSDHTSGSTSAIVARALGAAVFERHLTLDRAAVGPDHQASSEPAQLRSYVRHLHEVDQALGTGHKHLVASERTTVGLVRRGYYAARDLRAGSVIEASDVRLLRPVRGVPASEQILGAVIIADIAKGEPVYRSQLSPSVGDELG